MAFNQQDQFLSEMYFGEDAYFEDPEDLNVGLNTAINSVDNGASWEEVHATGGDKNLATSLHKAATNNNPNATIAPNTTMDYLTIQGQQVSIEHLLPLIDHLGLNIADIMDQDLNEQDVLESVFPPEMVAQARLDGVVGADILYDPQYGDNAYYWNAASGIFGGHIPVSALRPDLQNRILQDVGTSVFNDFMHLGADYTLNDVGDAGLSGGTSFVKSPGALDTSGVVIGLDGKLIPRTRFHASIGSTIDQPGSFIASYDLNNDGVIDGKDAYIYGQELAVKQGLTPEEWKVAIDNTSTPYQTYVDLGLSGNYSSGYQRDDRHTVRGEPTTEVTTDLRGRVTGTTTTVPESAFAGLIKNYPVWKTAIDAYAEDGTVDKSFDLNNDGKVDSADFDLYRADEIIAKGRNTDLVEQAEGLGITIEPGWKDAEIRDAIARAGTTSQTPPSGDGSQPPPSGDGGTTSQPSGEDTPF